tara:strand:- start:44 stop:1618 length:1575 start_codon:yes stop_codon:yes gene_type:complete
MLNTHYRFLLFLVIIIEGYIVLSTELLAIRQSIPFVGSGTDTVSVIIAAVLMPLAFGYQAGGNFKIKRLFGKRITVRRKLIINITIAALILLPGLSYQFMLMFFSFLSSLEITNRIHQISIYSILFLVIPVYLLGQTVPLVSNFFGRERLPEVTGKILFFSTVGSFLGAVFSTLFLMNTIGVNHTVTLNFVLMAILVILLSKKQASVPVIITTLLAFGTIALAAEHRAAAIVIALLSTAIVITLIIVTRRKTSLAVFAMIILSLSAIWFNSNSTMRNFRMVKLNMYHNIQVVNVKNGNRHLMLNNNYSSRYNPETGRKHHYIEFAEKVAISPILNSNPPRDVLVIGAGGFTFGSEDKNNNYVYVDIDKDLKNISEKYILGRTIDKNKTFEAVPIRAYLASTDQKFDVIYLDAYLGGVSVPEHLITKEFFETVKEHLKDKGLLVTNFIASPNFNNQFSRNLDNTIRSVFPHISRQAILENYLLWDENPSAMANISYIYKHEDNYDAGQIYTDDKKTVVYDLPKGP